MLLKEIKQPDIQIKKCNDIEMLIDLENRIFDEYTRDERGDLESRINIAKILYCDGEPVGYYMVEPGNYLYAIGIVPELRGKGLAEFLLQKALVETKNSMTLHVAEWNKGAIALYKKYGFVTEKMEKDFYSSGRHAVFMRKNGKPNFNPS